MGWNDKDDKYNRGSAWFYSTAFIAFSSFSSGQDQLKRALYAGILGLTERNSCEHVHAESRLMYRGSFQEKKGFMLHCALSVQRFMKSCKTRIAFPFSSNNVQYLGMFEIGTTRANSI